MKSNQTKYFQVVKSNSLIQAKYRLSIQEQRIMLLAISQIAKDEILTDQVMYSVKASDFKKFTDISLKRGQDFTLEFVPSLILILNMFFKPLSV